MKALVVLSFKVKTTSVSLEYIPHKKLKLRQLLLHIDKCTDPATGKEDWRYINAFCDRVNKDYDGYNLFSFINMCTLAGLNFKLCTSGSFVLCVVTVL